MSDLPQLLNMSELELEQYDILLSLPDGDELLKDMAEKLQVESLINCPKCGYQFRESDQA